MADARTEPAGRRIRLPDWHWLAALSGPRRWVLVVATAAALVIAVVGAAAAGGSRNQDYRTATAERATVDSTVESTGTIAPINQASLAFPTAGTVAAVPVVIGQHVTIGQLLAQLDTTSLDAQVASAQSSVAAAQARLAADESGQGGGSGGASSGGSPGAGGSAGTGAVTGTAPAGTGYGSVLTAVPAMYTAAAWPATAAPRGPSIADLQTQLVADQHRSDLALTAEKAELTAEAAACKSFIGGGSVTVMPSSYVPPSGSPAAPGSGPSSNAATATPAPAPAPSNTAKPPAAAPAPAPAPSNTAKPPAAAPAPAAPDATACQNEIGKVIEQQITVSQDEQAVAADEVALNNALGKQASPAAPSAGGAGRSAAGGTGGTGAGPAGGAGRSSGGAGVSAEQLAADQGAIDAADAALAVTQQSLDQAKLVSPIDGTVGAVNIAAGQNVAAAAGTSNPQIVVIGPGTNQVTTTVSDLSVGAVRVGSPARVTPSGSNTPIDATVVSVGLLGTSSGTAVSYPVTISLTGTSPQLFDGQGATVSIVTAQVRDVLAVPSSAVHTVGANHTITVVNDGTPVTTRVETGAVGSTLTQIISGLNAGDEVMLADLSQPLPSTSGGVRGIGGAGGAGRPGG